MKDTDPPLLRLLREVRGRFGPLTTADKVLVVLLGGLFLVGLGAVLTGPLRAIENVCVATEELQGAALPAGAPLPGDVPVVRGVEVRSSQLEFCAGDPTAAQHWLNAAARLPELVVMVVGLVLLFWFLWGAVRPGPHSEVSPGRLRALGWFLLIAGPVAAGVAHYANARLVFSMLRDSGASGDRTLSDSLSRFSWSWSNDFQHAFPWWYVFAGVALLLFSRLLRIGVRMGRELAAVV